MKDKLIRILFGEQNNILQFISLMKRKCLFQNNLKMAELESRLNRNHYLSKDSIPGAADAKIFNLLETFRQIPQRKTHPNLYYWYIIIKQFSNSTRSKWLLQQKQDCEDDLIQEVINSATNKTSETVDQNKQNFSPLTEIIKADVAYHYKFQQAACHFLNIPCQKTKYILNISFKQNMSSQEKEIRSRLEKANIEVYSYEMNTESDGTDLLIKFKAQEADYESLKDQISKWPQISNFLTKQQKKFVRCNTLSMERKQSFKQ